MKLQVLMIEDDEATLYSMREALESENYALLDATDGEHGLELIREKHPQIVLTDYMLPGMSGMDVLRAAKKEDSSPLVIFLTAYGSEDVAVEAMKAGAYDYIKKPFEVEDLRQKVRRAAESVTLLHTAVEKVLFLRGTDIFSKTPPDSLLHVAAVAHELSVSVGEVIFREGDVSDYLYLVFLGKVRISREGKEIFVALPHESFGLVGLAEERPRATTATALEDSHLLRIGQADLFDLMEDDAHITKGVLRGLAKVLREVL